MAPLVSLSGALLVIGLPFTVQWERASGIDPAAFGNVVAACVLVGIALAFVVGVRARRWRGRLGSLGVLIGSAGSVVVIASRSGSITAEGLLAAMLLPLGFLAAGVLASLVDAILVTRTERVNVRSLVATALLVSLSAAVAWRLPVVQFVHGSPSGGIYPVQGGWLAFVGGVAAGAIAGPMWSRSRWHWVTLLIPAAVVLGYTLQASFGAALAILGVCVVMPAMMRTDTPTSA